MFSGEIADIFLLPLGGKTLPNALESRFRSIVSQETPGMESHAEIVNELRWKKFPVLNDGFVCLVDVMGDDSSVVQAARVSYGEGTKKVSDDRTLIRYLLRHRHTTPFEMAEIKILVRVPMDCWRQWIRHRTANVNEYSTRYSLAIDATQATPTDEWRTQAESNRQGSGDPLPTELGEQLTASEREFQEAARKLYQDRIDSGVAREQARKDLPLCTYTEAYWKIDLHNLLHFLSLRMDSHAQQEIRDYATSIGENIVKPLF
ncbi:MAG TPA: FAD-dependent thymidylate synthase, partial [Planctomycetaceae bacterium]|nr:FAD-dependent thymidylate synthase [Planctomycetaceae bacterium]